MNVLVITKPEITVEADLYEFRLDLFDNVDFDLVARLMQDRRVIFTHRTASLDELEKLLELGPEYVDLDCMTPKSFLKKVKCKVICSYHNYDETPEDLKAIKLFDADEYKLATMARSTLDSLRMLEFVQKREHFTGICMGEDGKITRQLAPLVGSTFNFVNIKGEGSAPGQLSLDELLPVNKDTKIYGLIGDPVDQSPSNITHNRVLQKMGINAVYLKMRVKQGEVGEFLRRAERLPFQGLSVTVPLKEKVIHGEVVNTLKRSNGKWCGINTDGAGALDALETHRPIEGMRMLVVGAGGAAKGIINEALFRNVNVAYTNRSKKDVGVRFVDQKEAFDILVNTTPVVHEMPIPEEWLQKEMLVMDISLKPLETTLLKKAKAIGCDVINGHAMWVNQANRQFNYWFESCDSNFVRALLT